MRLKTTANQKEKTMIDAKTDLKKLLADSDALIRQGRDILVAEGKVMDLREWITLADYAKKHHKKLNLITQWISRGVVPADCYVEIPSLGKKLILDRVYRE
ncbi:hypothetical protein [Siphonobacter aquaeclarae]|jgi:hypothetical protein|uniref:Uncharacterized protein n=1 Tax=Siphonobacter aquaeclarae TaxID=563176 RepID=A0A1G9KPR5_9BACT|nr:hypothetical protein [Siphonobacter aquaeclarae]SDL51748.1 hypothetical protein SAMN04488090_1100 [Siphonobacter aquaeclarae]